MRKFVGRGSLVSPRAHETSRTHSGSGSLVQLISGTIILGAAMLAGCASGNVDVDIATNKPITSAAKPPSVNGVVHGGQQPVSGAIVQLWQVGTTGYGIGATALGTSTTTDQNGNWDITNNYSCSAGANLDNTLLYITATGGNPGLGQGTNNAALSMMAALGRCGNLTAATFVNIDEVTTVASAYSLAQFMTPTGGVGSFGSSNRGLMNAFATFNNLVNVATGAALSTTPNGNGIVPQAEINTLADILSICINSPGPTSPSCASLFSAATLPNGTAPTNTLSAILFVDGQSFSGVRSLPELNQIADSHAAPSNKTTVGLAAIALTDPVVPDQQILGPTSRVPLTLTWFVDVRSPLAARQAELIQRLAKQYDGRVRVLFRAFALEQHPDSRLSSAALKQDKFWPMFDALAQRRDTLDRAKLLAIADSIVADHATFVTALDASTDDVTLDINDAARRGVQGAPVLFINQQRIDGLQPDRNYLTILDSQLKAAPPVQASLQKSSPPRRLRYVRLST